jgi:hypothetical protein
MVNKSWRINMVVDVVVDAGGGGHELQGRVSGANDMPDS